MSVRLQRREDLSGFRRAVVLVGSGLAGALASGVVVWLCGYDPLLAAQEILAGSFGSPYNLAQMAAAAIPVATIALGAAITFRLRVWNIGGEGQFYMGACGATAVELMGGPDGWPAWLLLPAMMAAGCAAGALWAAVPALLRAHRGVNEIITTLMLNYVAVLFVGFLVFGPWKNPAGRNFPFSSPFPPTATLPGLGAGQLHTGVFVPVVVAMLLLLVLTRTTWGYELRMIGHAPGVARMAGMSVPRAIVAAMLVSGGLAGLAGMVHVSGVVHMLSAQMSNNYGYTAIIVAWVAQLHPLAILVVSLLFGVLINGSFAVSQVGIPPALGFLSQGMVLFFVIAGAAFFSRYRLVIRGASAKAPSTPSPPGRAQAAAP